MGYHRVKDYMAAPKESGYRGIHVMCRNDADFYGYKNLDVEVQVRTLKQHGWATAVEIYDLITGASLKSGGGTQEQKRFFQLASELMNDDSANTATAIAELKALDDKLGVLSTLREATDSMYFVHDGDIEISRSDSCLVAVDLGVQQISIEIFSSDNESEAADRYTELESTEEEGNTEEEENPEEEGDTEEEVERLWSKIWKLRIFPDGEHHTGASLGDVEGEVLVVSQFTLYADCRKGNRPSFTGAGEPGESQRLYELFVERARRDCGHVATGEFGADMQVSLVNDGPFTICLDTDDLKRPRR